MENIKLDAKQLVEKFGNDKQKESFDKTGKIGTRTKDALIKEAETEYESVEIVKEGRSNVYVLSGLKKEKEIKVDGRHSNGDFSIQYTKNMDLLVVATLEDENIVTGYAQTMRKWLLDFGLITRELFDLMGSAYSFKKQLNVIDELTGESILTSADEQMIVKDYIDYTKELQGQLESTLARMAKAGIINLYPVYKAKVILDLNNRDITKTKNVHEMVMDAIVREKRTLLGEYGLSEYDIIHLKNKKEVKQFEKKFNYYLENNVYDEEGNHLCIDYYWKAFAIQIKGSKNKVEKYLNKYNAEAIEAYKVDTVEYLVNNQIELKARRTDRVVELAEKKDKYVKENKLKPNFSDDLAGRVSAESFVGSLKYNKGYYNMFLGNLYVEKIKELEEHYQYSF